MTISETIKNNAENNPNAIALKALDKTPLSYKELYDHILCVRDTLNSIGIGRNDRAAIVLPNGDTMASAFLGIASCAASAPLNPLYKEEEFSFYLSDLKADALIIEAYDNSPARTAAAKLGIHIIELLPDRKKAGIFTLTDDKKINREPKKGFAEPQDLALILHTAGTTTRPKIVTLTQTNIFFSANRNRTCLKLDEQDISLNVMPLFHIHGLVGTLLASITAGGGVVAAPGFYAPKFFTWMKEFSPTWYSAVPTIHQSVLQKAKANKDIIDMCALRFIRSAGSYLSPDLMAELQNTFNCPVIEGYGMTEAVPIASNFFEKEKQKPGSAGVAEEEIEIAIMDESYNLLPCKSIGEVIIKGENVIKCYENNPEANKESFINESPRLFSNQRPLNNKLFYFFARHEKILSAGIFDICRALKFSHNKAKKQNRKLCKGLWFRTGDQGYIDEDGYLFITGRIKEIINRGGEKISPQEIDEVLQKHPHVRQSVTFAMHSKQLGEDIAAAIILKDNEKTTQEEIQKFAASQLADFKIPSKIIFLDEIPKGPTGKLQRIGLAEKLGITGDNLEANNERKESFAPLTETEKQLQQIWIDVLEINEININYHFSNLDGDSILAAQIIAIVRNAMNVELDFIDFSNTPTISSMAALIDIKKSKPDAKIFLNKQAANPIFWLRAGKGFESTDIPIIFLETYWDEIRTKVTHTKIEEMAADYVNQIKKHQTKGPYALGGFSIGGLLALEAANILQEEGESLSFLFLVDPSDLSYKRESGFEYNIRCMRREKSPLKKINHFKKAFNAAIKDSYREILYELYFKLNKPLTPYLKFYYGYKIYEEAIAQYKHPLYSGDSAIYLTKSNLDNKKALWHLICNNADIHVVDTDEHIDIVVKPEFNKEWLKDLRARFS